MNTQELAAKVEGIGGLNKADAKTVVQTIFDAVATSVAADEDVVISGFGKFSLKKTSERQGRNPATGEAMTIAAGKKAAFTPAKGLKDRLSA